MVKTKNLDKTRISDTLATARNFVCSIQCLHQQLNLVHALVPLRCIHSKTTDGNAQYPIGLHTLVWSMSQVHCVESTVIQKCYHWESLALWYTNILLNAKIRQCAVKCLNAKHSLVSALVACVTANVMEKSLLLGFGKVWSVLKETLVKKQGWKGSSLWLCKPLFLQNWGILLVESSAHCMSFS